MEAIKNPVENNEKPILSKNDERKRAEAIKESIKNRGEEHKNLTQ